MRTPRLFPYPLAGFILCYLLGALLNPSYASEDKQKALQQLNEKIGQLKKSIETKENSKSRLNRQLRQTEKKISALTASIRETTKNIDGYRQQLERLQQQQQTMLQNIQSENKALHEQLRAAYQLGEQEQLKLLFSLNDLQQVQRNLVYYQYFSHYRIQQIAVARTHFSKLEAQAAKITETQRALQDQLIQLTNQRTDLEENRKQRKSIIASIDREIQQQGTRLSQLEEDAKNLRQLVDSVSEIAQQHPIEDAHRPFSTQIGKLSWPVKGQVKKLFGHLKPPSQLRWQGVVINARQGNNVRAIYHGRVAFSDWLRGMGNLIIIDHGNGYLSLYGHNEALFKEPGEWVDAGDIIASIGNSGGQKTAGVYFEIRKNGKPNNPSKWCKTENWFTSI